MGNCLSICRSRKKDIPPEVNNTTQNDILINQLGPYSKNNESGLSLNHNNNNINQNDILKQGNKEQLIQINTN